MLYIIKTVDNKYVITKMIFDHTKPYGVYFEVRPFGEDELSKTFPYTLSKVEANELCDRLNNMSYLKWKIEPYSYPEKHCSFCQHHQKGRMICRVAIDTLNPAKGLKPCFRAGLVNFKPIMSNENV